MANQYTKARAEQAAAEKIERQEAAGIPDSPVFNRPPAESESRLAGCHVGGIPVENLPPEMRAHLRFELTDEGTLLRDREYQAKLAAGQVSRIEMESDQETERKRFGVMGDRLKRGATPEECGNPMQDLIAQHLEPDESGRWMDPETVDILGPRGFTPVLDKDGNKVTCGQSFLGKRSREAEELAQRRKAARNAAKLTAIQQQVSEQAEQLAHAQRAAGLPVGVTGAPIPAGLRIGRDIDVSTTGT